MMAGSPVWKLFWHTILCSLSFSFSILSSVRAESSSLLLFGLVVINLNNIALSCLLCFVTIWNNVLKMLTSSISCLQGHFWTRCPACCHTTPSSSPRSVSRRTAGGCSTNPASPSRGSIASSSWSSTSGIIENSNSTENKFALLWGEAQLCLPYICL